MLTQVAQEVLTNYMRKVLFTARDCSMIACFDDSRYCFSSCQTTDFALLKNVRYTHERISIQNLEFSSLQAYTNVWTALGSALLQPTENDGYRIFGDVSRRERSKGSMPGVYLFLRR